MDVAKKIPLLAAVVLLGSCSLTRAELVALTDRDLVDAGANHLAGHRDLAIAEAARRFEWGDDVHDAILSRQMWLGMDWRMLLLSRGHPWETDRVVTVFGDSDTYTWGTWAGARGPTIAWLTDGIVTSFRVGD